MQTLTQSSLKSKWSEQILRYGFTAVPNLLLRYRSAIGLTSTECLVLIAIDSFRWSSDNPWPSLNALSKRSGYSPRTLSRTITRLEEKGVIVRIGRTGTSNEYDLYPLIRWLEHFLEHDSTYPSDKIDTTQADNSGHQPKTALSPKEYPYNTHKRKPFKNIVEPEVLPPGWKPQNNQ